MIVATFTNKEDQMQSTVLQISGKNFKVLLTDMEAERTLPYIHIYDNLEGAINKAKQWANVN